MKREGVYVRYVGAGVREVPGVGTFQNGTTAFLPRDVAFDLLKDDDFVAPGDPTPATVVIFRVGEKRAGE